MATFKSFLTTKELWNLSSVVVNDKGKFILNVSDRMDIFAGSIYFRFENSKLYFVVVDYKTEAGNKFVKYPGGISKKDENEKAVDTCYRESAEESGFRPLMQFSKIVHSRFFPFKINKEREDNCNHWKIFWLHYKKTGSLRSVSNSDLGENSPAYWMEADEVLGLIHWYHKQACINAILDIISTHSSSKDVGIRTACYYMQEELRKNKVA